MKKFIKKINFIQRVVQGNMIEKNRKKTGKHRGSKKIEQIYLPYTYELYCNYIVNI